jgi:ATPase subunit of ABC transporter with duplicated ATPase domains
MAHQPIKLHELSLIFPHKVCFENFNATIHSGDRIAIIGQNGSGKSSLLRALTNKSAAISGTILLPEDVVIGYVPQIITEFSTLSGGERFNQALTQALSVAPNVLLLDEPTNHLDSHNRKSLRQMLEHFSGTLIVVSHDRELLDHCLPTLWHLADGNIHIFTGRYQNYLQEITRKRAAITQALTKLTREKKTMQQALMQAQQRSAKSRASGKKKIANRRWLQATGDLKAMQAEKSQGNKLAAIAKKKQALNEQLTELRLPATILPQFSFKSAAIGEHTLIAIHAGTIAYQPEKYLLQDLNLLLTSKDRIAIIGDNGSGKSTLLKAILGDPKVPTTGSWLLPQPNTIGYLD